MYTIISVVMIATSAFLLTYLFKTEERDGTETADWAIITVVDIGIAGVMGLLSCILIKVLPYIVENMP